MITSILLLFVSSIAGGLIGIRLRKIPAKYFSFILVFAGAYLFAITIIHILPELFIQASQPLLVGAIVLAGFYLQQMLEYITRGAEHGHLHHPSKDHHHLTSTGLALLSGLSVHAFLEGTILAKPMVGSGAIDSLLVGIILHKIPAAFAMMTILTCCYPSNTKPLIYLFLFSLASPLGLMLNQAALSSHFLNNAYQEIIYALVGGSFMHISTTIVFEGNPGHALALSKLLTGLLGASLAIAIALIS